MPAKLSEGEVAKRFKKLEPDYIVLSPYIANNKKVKVRHKCGHEYEVTPSHLWNGRGCPKCAKQSAKKKLSKSGEERFEKMLAQLDLSVAPDFVYQNNRQVVEVRCNKCGRVQHSWIINIVSGHGCASCNNKLSTKTEDFIKKLKDKAPEWELCGKYYGATVPTMFYHKKCGKKIERVPYVVTSQPDKCKYCHPSGGEQSIVDYIVSLLHDEDVVLNDRKILDGKELDLVIPRLNIAFEYDGLYYHCDKILKSKYHNPIRYHLCKTEECYKKGIRLIHIFEDEWLEKPEIVKDKIKAYLKVDFDNRYFARNLVVKEVDKKDAKAFLEHNHIQGNGGNKVAYGLYSDKELLAVQTFSERSSGVWELTRYATKLGCQVVGGFSKCLRKFEVDNSPKTVYSFADRRWCNKDDNVYNTCGFSIVSIVPPNYWYTKWQKRYHKFNFRKSLIEKKFPRVYSPDKTEREMMEEAGYNRIYDCGLFKYQKDY